MVYMDDDRSRRAGRGRRRHLARYRQVALVLVKYRLKDFLKALGLERYLPLRWIPSNPLQKMEYSKPERARMALEELGTTFVKIGQILSTRTDLLPKEYTAELAKLQNSLKPLPVQTVEEVIAGELGKPVNEIFSSFDPNPVGVASIGQAHAATLKDGTEVIVKARKPGVQEQVAVDLDILRDVTGTASQRWEGSQQYDIRGVVEEVGETLMAEMDYLKEGHNAEYFTEFFAKDKTVYIPKIFWEYTTSRVITLERLRGIPIAEVQALDEAGYDRSVLAKNAMNLWLKMVFTGAEFHADPHPGNLIIQKDGRIGLIDFGMVGTVDDEVRESLSNAVRGILERNVDLLVDSLIDLGAVRRDGSRDALRSDLRHVMGHYPKLATGEVHIQDNFSELFIVVRRNHVQLPSNTFLLLKTMAMVQALGKQLDKDLDMMALLEPHVRRFIRDRHSPITYLQKLPVTMAEFIELGIGLPQRMNRIIKSVERGELKVKTDVSGLEVHLEHLEKIVNRMILGIIAAAIILGITVLVLAFSVRG